MSPLSSESVNILAHQGGWDEMALLAGPVLAMAVLGYLARRGANGDDGGSDVSNEGAAKSIDSTEGRPESSEGR